MEALTNPNDLRLDAVRRLRAQERLYVICQVLGWGSFLGAQLVFTMASSKPGTPDAMLRHIADIVMVTMLGWLISHGGRTLIKRRGWKQFGWRALAWRVPVLALTESVLWTAVSFGYIYGLLEWPWTYRYGVWLMSAASIFNGTAMLAGWLCIYFIYHLYDRFNRSEIDRARLTATAKDAELRALKAQVNPHFIFNALNSVRALIDEDPPRARQAVTQLANLLRYSLQSGQLEVVPFEEELSVVNDYLALEQVRHEERLRLRVDVDPAALRFSLPPMLLQTLVENAVKYGIAQLPEGGEVAIIAREVSGGMILRVTNPGTLPQAPSQRPQGTGLGLRNATERLRLLYGDKASLRLRMDGANLVVAEARIPQMAVKTMELVSP